MALVTNVTKEVQIPGEDETAVIRKLSHVQLKTASKARQSEGVGFMRELGAELMKALREADTQTVKNIQETTEADISNYDRDTLLRLGVVSWSYSVPPIGLEKTGVSNGLDELDEPTAKFLATEIFEFSRPQTSEEIKKESSVSTNSSMETLTHQTNG